MSGHPPVDEHAAVASSGTLRGASVDVDARRIARLLALVVLAGIVVLIAVLVVAGVNKNSQIEELHDHGLLIDGTVLSCRSNLGGSGSNAVGFSCSGAYRVHGQRYVVSLPGSDLHAPGTSVRVVVASTDPRLFTTPSLLAAERTSSRVFLVPALLTVALLALLGTLVWRARGRSATKRASAGR